MGGIGSGRPTKAGVKAEKKVVNMTPARKRTIVANYFFKGYEQHQIVAATGLTKKEVLSAVQSIKEQLKPKSIPEMEYYRNKSRKLISIGLSTAFSIADDEKNMKYPNLRLRALQVIKEYAKLQADIDGITGEKATAGPDKRAGDLMSELKRLASQPKITVEKEDKSYADADQRADRPDAETDTNNEGGEGDERVSAVRVAGSDNI